MRSHCEKHIFLLIFSCCFQLYESWHLEEKQDTLRVGVIACQWDDMGFYSCVRLQKFSEVRATFGSQSVSHSPYSNRSSRDIRRLALETCNTETVIMWKRHSWWCWSGLSEVNLQVKRMWEGFYAIFCNTLTERWNKRSVVSLRCLSCACLLGKDSNLEESVLIYEWEGKKSVQSLNLLELYPHTWSW